jgi:hypothetical protein
LSHGIAEGEPTIVTDLSPTAGRAAAVDDPLAG